MQQTILLVEDEDDLLQILSEAVELTLPAYEVRRASSIDEADTVIRDLEASGGQLALVVVDHLLGGRTGLDFLETLRARTPGLPCMLYTGQAPPEVEERAQNRGIRVVWKPIRLKVWLGEVRELLAS